MHSSQYVTGPQYRQLILSQVAASPQVGVYGPNPGQSWGQTGSWPFPPQHQTGTASQAPQPALLPPYRPAEQAPQPPAATYAAPTLSGSINYAPEQWGQVASSAGQATSPDAPEAARAPAATSPGQATAQANASEFPAFSPNFEASQVTATPANLDIDPSLKERIWSHQWIDFSSLLNKSTPKAYKLNFDPVKGLLIQSPDSDNKPSLSIERWTSAFILFALVYLEKFLHSHPHKAAELLHYLETIRSAASLYGPHG